MENRLRKHLALIKSRAKEMSQSVRERRASATLDLPPIDLTQAVPGKEHAVRDGCFYLIRIEHEDIATDVPEVTARFLDMSRRETWPLISLVRDPGPAMAGRIRNHELCFLDIETTGLSPSTYVFLCGLMFLEEGRFVVEQLFARDYSEEAGMLGYLGAVVERYPMIVTYNGTGFDVPFLKTRMAVARMAAVKPFEHVDLFEGARERFRELLPNSKLETIERHLRGESRVDDIPGREIPEAYHQFVRTGNARDIQRILYHNRMDLLAMVYLINDLAEGM